MRKSFFISGLIILLNIFSAACSYHLAAQEFGYQPFKECWKLQLPILKNSRPASDNINVFLPLPEGVIEAVNIRTGAIAWKTEIGGQIDGKILVDKNNLYVVSKTDGDNSTAQSKLNVSSISAETGVVQWRTEIGADSGLELAELFIIDSASLLVISAGRINLLNLQNGLSVSSSKLNFSPGAVVLAGENHVYLSDSTSHKIFKIEMAALRTSQQPAEIEVFSPESAVTAVIQVGVDLYVGDKLGKVYKVNGSRRAVWVSRVGAEVSNITENRGRLLISSADNYVYLLAENNGRRVWKKRLGGNVRGEPLIIGDLAVLAPNGGDIAEFVEMKKGKTVNRLQLKTDTENENFFLNSPFVLPNEFILFPTAQGYTAFSSPDCASNEIKIK